VLARIAREADLTLFAHYDTDLAGHRQDLAEAVAALERLDAFLGGLLGALGGDTLLVVASDHGNIEDVTTGHTRNPVPVVAAGPGGRGRGRRVASIADVAPALLSTLGSTDVSHARPGCAPSSTTSTARWPTAPS
jgi:2,3-bisphosphoglycerate-independent phosphoglycerate mutase